MDNLAKFMRGNSGEYRGGDAPAPVRRGSPLLVSKRRAGIEIELENAPRLNMKYWASTEDGSLRNNGTEYVTTGDGYGGYDLVAAIMEIDERLNEAGVDANWRTSTHVHVDCRDMDCNTLRKFLLGSVIYEEVMFNIAGPQRHKNNFCIPYDVAQEQILMMSEAFRVNNFNMLNHMRLDKYCSINLLSLYRYGTIEFRLSESKYTRGDLLRLVNRFLVLAEFAENNSEMDENEYIEMLFNTDMREVLKHSWPREIELTRDMLLSGYENALDIVNFAGIEVNDERKRRMEEMHRMAINYGDVGMRVGGVEAPQPIPFPDEDDIDFD